MHNNDGAQDFASLPPLLNVLSGFGGAGSEHEQNSTDVLDGSGSNPNMSRGYVECIVNRRGVLISNGIFLSVAAFASAIPVC